MLTKLPTYNIWVLISGAFAFYNLNCKRNIWLVIWWYMRLHSVADVICPAGYQDLWCAWLARMSWKAVNLPAERWPGLLVNGSAMLLTGFSICRLWYQKPVFRTCVSNYIPQLPWDVTTYACPRYLLPTPKSSYIAFTDCFFQNLVLLSRVLFCQVQVIHRLSNGMFPRK